jgi:hypothetical protein
MWVIVPPTTIIIIIPQKLPLQHQRSAHSNTQPADKSQIALPQLPANFRNVLPVVAL